MFGGDRVESERGDPFCTVVTQLRRRRRTGVGITQIRQPGCGHIAHEFVEVEGLVVLHQMFEIQVAIAETVEKVELVLHEARERTGIATVFTPERKKLTGGRCHLRRGAIWHHPAKGIAHNSPRMPSRERIETDTRHAGRSQPRRHDRPDGCTDRAGHPGVHPMADDHVEDAVAPEKVLVGGNIHQIGRHQRAVRHPCSPSEVSPVGDL